MFFLPFFFLAKSEIFGAFSFQFSVSAFFLSYMYLRVGIFFEVIFFILSC